MAEYSKELLEAEGMGGRKSAPAEHWGKDLRGKGCRIPREEERTEPAGMRKSV